MPTPTDHKTIQARIVKYAESIGWILVPREQAEQRREFNLPSTKGYDGSRPDDAQELRAKKLSPFFDDLLDAKVREFNPRYAEVDGALPDRFRHLHTAIYGNREFLNHLRNRGKFFDHIEKRERNLILIDYDTPAKNVFEVTEEWVFHNVHFITQENVVFLINGIPVLLIDCQNEPIVIKEGGFSNPPFKMNRGFENPPHNINRGFENPLSFLNPHAEIDKRKHRLPHWQQGATWVYVTWRLGDSLPKAKLNQWAEERAIWRSHHPEPWNEKTETEYHDRFSNQIDDWLDQGSGSCVLKDPANARIVADALQHFNGERYEIVSFVVMPNHVHVLFRPLGKHTLSGILKSWKGFTAREINKRIGKTGALWQDAYWDRLIRSGRHFFKVVAYIRENPVKANLQNGQFVLWEGGHSCPPFYGGLENPPSGNVPDHLEAKVKTFCAIPQVMAFLKAPPGQRQDLHHVEIQM